MDTFFFLVVLECKTLPFYVHFAGKNRREPTLYMMLLENITNFKELSPLS